MPTDTNHPHVIHEVFYWTPLLSLPLVFHKAGWPSIIWTSEIMSRSWTILVAEYPKGNMRSSNALSSSHEPERCCIHACISIHQLSLKQHRILYICRESFSLSIPSQLCMSSSHLHAMDMHATEFTRHLVGRLAASCPNHRWFEIEGSKILGF